MAYSKSLLNLLIIYFAKEGYCVELELMNDLLIQCNCCGAIHIIDKDSLEIETYSYERQMGAEVEYSFDGESECSCGNELRYSVKGFEYPVGCLNYDDYECYGGVFKQPPEVVVNYYEFDYDEYDEAHIHSDISRIRDNIEWVIENNDNIYRLSPREFEELVARVFEDNGYIVELTPETRDGGRDIIATHTVGGLSYMVLIECKKYRRTNKVGVSLIRSLLGVQTDQKANKCVLVTTSSFTRDARAFAERQNTLIELIDYNDLLNMIAGTT